MDRTRYHLVSKKIEKCIPGSRDKWKVIEYVLSLVLQVNPHGYIKITLLPNKTGGLHSRKKRQMESSELPEVETNEKYLKVEIDDPFHENN